MYVTVTQFGYQCVIIFREMQLNAKSNRKSDGRTGQKLNARALLSWRGIKTNAFVGF